MFQQAKWFGFSLALHLTVAASLIFVASRNADRTPKAIMVVLDNLALPDLPRQKPAEPVVRPPAPARPVEPVKPEQLRQTQQTHSPIATPAPDQALGRDVPKTSPEAPAVVSRPRSENATPVPTHAARTALQHSASATEERQTPEKAQQRYLKEHFTYIRDLITKQLAYPSIARKMRWSGKTVVAFVISEDGTVHDIRVVESSGFPILDKSATETVRNVSPFPKPPVRAEIVVPISFKLL